MQIYSFSTNSTFYVTAFNETDFSILFVFGASTLLSSLNVVGNILDSGTELTNLNYNSILNPPACTSCNNPSTFVSTLCVSGSTSLIMIQRLIHHYM
jgi:hypothetical protein